MKPFQQPEFALETNQQDYATLMNRALQLQRNPPGVLDPRVQAGLTIDDLTRPEFQWLRRTNLYEAAGGRLAVVAQRAYMQLVPAPGMLTVVSEVKIYNANAFTQILNVGMALGNAPLSGIPTSILDDRIPAFQSAAAVSSGSTAAPIAPTGQLVVLVTQQSITIPCNYVLTGNKGPAAPPFRCVSVVDTAVNTQINVGFTWSERFLLPSEG